jgi:hypothetical protein
VEFVPQSFFFRRLEIAVPVPDALNLSSDSIPISCNASMIATFDRNLLSHQRSWRKRQSENQVVSRAAANADSFGPYTACGNRVVRWRRARHSMAQDRPDPAHCSPARAEPEAVQPAAVKSGRGFVIAMVKQQDAVGGRRSCRGCRFPATSTCSGTAPARRRRTAGWTRGGSGTFSAMPRSATRCAPRRCQPSRSMTSGDAACGRISSGLDRCCPAGGR